MNAEELEQADIVNRQKLDLFIHEKWTIMRDQATALVQESQTYAVMLNHTTAALDRLAGSTGNSAELLRVMREEHKALITSLKELRGQIQLTRAASRTAGALPCPQVDIILANRDKEAQQLLELIGRQDRELALMAGEKIEPMMHFAEAIVTPRGGQ